MSSVESVRWCRSSCECGGTRGSANRYQMRVYALNVAIALTGRAACVHCGTGVTLWSGDVDRTVPGSCYKPGGVVMVCEACNIARNTESLDDERYVSDVRRASNDVRVIGVTDAARLYRQGRDAGQLARSPYAVL